MIRIKLLLILTILCIGLPETTQAQTAYWAVPATYVRITPFSEVLYKATTYSEMVLVDGLGSTLSETKADSITNLTNGYALILTSSDGKYRIKGIVDHYGKVTPVTTELYAGYYAFFSEDKCPVYNKKGKYGFMDTHGKLVVPCDYVTVHPFKEGLASVGKAKGGFKGLMQKAANAISSDVKIDVGPSTYIDSKGVSISFQNEIGTPYVASSFKNGQAFVRNKEGKSFFIDRLGKILTMDPNVNLVFDDYFALVDDEANAERTNLPFPLSYNSAYSLFTEKGVLGYKKSGKVVVPAQFDEASLIYLNNGVVKLKGKYGLIGLDDSSVSCEVEEKDDDLEAVVTLPKVWENKIVNLVRISDGDRSTFVLTGSSSSRTLNVKVSNGQNVAYELESEGIIIWRSTDVKTDAAENLSRNNNATARKGFSISVPSNIKSNNKGVCNIVVRVTNNTGTAQDFNVSLSTGGSKSVRIASGRSGSVTLTAKVLKETSCIVKATCGAGTRTAKTLLKPLFVL